MENENGGVINASARSDIKLHRESRRASLHGTRLNGALDQSPKSRKLVLHFDIRNTILVADSVTNVDVDEALNTYLAGVTWGFPTADGWRWCSDTPSLKRPQKGAVTYYKYLEDRLVNERSDRTRLRKETGAFTQAEIGRRFQPYFAKHLQLLRWQHHQVDEKLTMKGKNGERYHYILPAFFRLLRHLWRTSRDFAVVLRTYGLDADNVLRSIEHGLAGHHPSLSAPLPIPVNRRPGRIHRSDDGHVEFHVRSPEGRDSAVYDRCRDVYDHLSRRTGVGGFVDDYFHWQGRGFHHCAGKPLWIDPSERTVQHIFFDDNIRISDVDNIVDLRMFEADGVSTRQLSVDETAVFEDMCLVQNDLLHAIEDVEYFVKKVEVCEEKYDHFLAKCQGSTNLQRSTGLHVDVR